ncbi:MAG: serine/threonine protein kinase, partial [Myxococcaceae bacterium]|nr:serine/threonine protein kinase [Myxococcaceae bacterium]
MSTPPSAYETLLLRRGIDPGALRVDERGTLAATPPPMAPRLSLPLLRTEASAEGPADVRMHALLGEGGMGRVFAAEQVALGREVAVKVLRDAGEEDATDALLREALIAARLEHPNVVPVYLLGRSPAGEPLFVMRRIEGVPWSAVLRDPAAAPGMFAGAGDPLEFHLGVFLEVCGAVQFAHSRGILHRDLKPDNVMLGAYREVYVVDWGIAVSLRDDPSLPAASEARQVSGTPGYMAPEMADPLGLSLSERTDVYLLGAVLHHVLTGAAPHAGATLLQQLAHAYESPAPAYAGDVPEEFAQVCARAMARDPAARFASVDELRRAVQDGLRHRSAWALSEEADRSARALRDELGRAGGAREGEAAARARVLFSEARFGYRQAL